MIFVTVGTQKFQMNRLMKQVEMLAAMMPEEEFVIQYGHCTYIPKNCKTFMFMDRPQFEECIDRCRLLISHGGVGTIMAGLRKHKPVIVVPRLQKYGEHVDDHQIEAAQALKHNKCLLICMNIEYLKYMVDNIDNYDFKPYIEPERKVEDIVIHCIEDNASYSDKHLLHGLFSKNDKYAKKSASSRNSLI
ncbi:MAG: glycosyl transferase [Butyrivibrio sp.]|uniref:PssE/Cps14G family polysaccharide biosynthesis glycosyltransferase n=1 Tax=Butyrivibrio sp. TaxID=28121 RepID=UPI0025DC65E0|nr:PssE/Cps14G family polysaccharide biosynthesis glycosyltransferase [Butyrivibrio sp.]MCR5772107.1 glycosyl transferase [Butyrivibrio sp.]